ncbi:MAG: right-handed parallel beta-helix repeat-containing protein [bacterium]
MSGGAVAVSAAIGGVGLAGNLLSSNSFTVLRLDGSGNKAKQNSLEGNVTLLGTENTLQLNTLPTCASQVIVDGSAYVVASNRFVDSALSLAATSNAVQVTKNEFSGVCGGMAVIIDGADHVVSQNTITGRCGDAVHVNGRSDLRFLNNVTRACVSGFSVYGGTNLTFIGNLASAHTNAGFLVSTVPTTLTFAKNVSLGNGGAGFFITQALTLTLTGNSAIGNGDAGVLLNGAAELHHNNLFGNGIKASATNPICRLVQIGFALADATANFWGDAAGPGADPTDDICINTAFIDASSPAAAGLNLKAAKAAPY